LCWNVSLINLAEATYVEFLAIPYSESVKQVNDFMEIFLAVLVDGSNGTEDFIFGDVRNSFGVIAEDLLNGLLEGALAVMGGA
jgi:hypothetical protein